MATPVQTASMRNLLRQLRPHLSQQLIGVSAFEGMEQICATFPPLSGLIIERHLGGRPTKVDLSLRMLSSDRGRAFLASRQDGVGKIARRWGDPVSPYRALEVIWLEFDQPQAGALRQPSVFLGVCNLQPPYGWIIQAAETLRSSGFSACVRSSIESILATSPGEPRSLQVGIMTSRGDDTIRLCLPMPAGAAATVCSAAGVANGANRVEAVLQQFTIAPQTPILLHIDVGETTGSTIGLEMKPGKQGSWKSLLAQIRSNDLCSSCEIEDLLAWPGSALALNSLGAEDISLQSPEHFASESVLPIQTLNHVKLVLQPDQPITAKIYLYAGFVWPHKG